MIDSFVSDIKLKYQNANGSIDNQVYISSNLPIETSKNIMDVVDGTHPKDAKDEISLFM